MRIMKIFYFLIPFLILGCAEKEFEYKNAKQMNLKSHYYKELVDYTKNGETFRTLELKYVKKTSFLDDGVRGEWVYYDEKHRLGKFKKVAKDLAVNGEKLLLIKEKKVIKLPSIIYLAKRYNNLITLIFEDNSYGIYDLNKMKIVFYKKDEDVISSTYLGEYPYLYRDLFLFPLLNGKIAVVDKRFNFIKNIDISSGSIIDNIIYMNIVKDNLLMATPKKLVLFNPNFLIDYKDDIKHVIDDKNYIYVFSVDGRVIKFDTNLKKIKSVDFPFASFFNPSFCKGNIYTLTYSGYLIKLNKDLNYSVFKVKDLNPAFPLKFKNCKIYNEDKVFLIE